MALNFDSSAYGSVKTKDDKKRESFNSMVGELTSIGDRLYQRKLQREMMDEDAKQKKFNNRAELLKNKIALLRESQSHGVVDPVSGETKTFPGIQGYRVDLDGDGFPDLFKDDGASAGFSEVKVPSAPRPVAGAVKAAGESAEAKSIADTAIAELNRIRPLNDESRGGLLGRVAQRAESAIDPDKPSTKFTNTSDVINSLKGMVVSVLKSTFGGQLSDGEREYLNEVYGAVEGMSRAERKIAIDGVERTLLGAQRRAASKAEAVGGTSAAAAPSGAQADNDPLGLR
jgi:hypothetical protein